MSVPPKSAASRSLDFLIVVCGVYVACIALVVLLVIGAAVFNV